MYSVGAVGIASRRGTRAGMGSGSNTCISTLEYQTMKAKQPNSFKIMATQLETEGEAANLGAQLLTRLHANGRRAGRARLLGCERAGATPPCWRGYTQVQWRFCGLHVLSFLVPTDPSLQLRQSILGVAVLCSQGFEIRRGLVHCQVSRHLKRNGDIGTPHGERSSMQFFKSITSFLFRSNAPRLVSMAWLQHDDTR